MSDEPTTSSSTVNTAMSAKPATQAFRLCELPTEIQLMIYKHAWTPGPYRRGKVKDYKTEIKVYICGGPNSFQLREQLSTIAKMGAVSRTMRDLVYHHEFFPRTQAYISTNCPPAMAKEGRRDCAASRRILEDSKLLLRDHLQHVCLVLDRAAAVHIREMLCMVNMGGFEPTRGARALRWLASLKALKTLEVVFDLGDLDRPLTVGYRLDGTAIHGETDQSPEFYVRNMQRLIQMLPKSLEKVVTRCYIRPGCVYEQWTTINQILKALPEFGMVKEEFDKLAATTAASSKVCSFAPSRTPWEFPSDQYGLWLTNR